MQFLFLDDVRQPEDAASYSSLEYKKLYRDNRWQIVRGYDTFVQYILHNGLPDVISFDYDLGAEKDGYDCAKWLINYMNENSFKVLPEILCHSMNPVGKENLLQYFKFVKRFFSSAD